MIIPKPIRAATQKIKMVVAHFIWAGSSEAKRVVNAPDEILIERFCFSSRCFFASVLWKAGRQAEVAGRPG